MSYEDSEDEENREMNVKYSEETEDINSHQHKQKNKHTGQRRRNNLDSIENGDKIETFVSYDIPQSNRKIRSTVINTNKHQG